MGHQHTNGHAVTTDAVPGGVPTIAGAGPVLRVQNAWLKRMRGRAVRLRLQDGEELAGVLEGDDSYTLALRLPGQEEPALVFKHAIAVLLPASAG
jgi:sRNA-binding regulator protein Hfq